MALLMIGTLLGGIGLFLLGMTLMTEGLKLAAGRTLRNILEHSTRLYSTGNSLSCIPSS